MKIGAGFFLLAAMTGGVPAWAADFSTVHVFDGLSDGRNPSDGLVSLGGVFYGVASSGGDWGWGTLFAFDPATATTTPLHNFSQGQDGGSPVGGLVAVQGVLYGTTSTGGSGNGTIFRFDPAAGTVTTLYDFAGGADGGGPQARLIAVGGLLYGTTAPDYAGSGPTGSTVFSFDPATGVKTTLYSFMNNGDGVLPHGALLASGDVLFGTTTQGTVFELRLSDLAFRTLHNFSVTAGNGPYGGLLLRHGQLYGTTRGGGTQGCGSVFRTNAGTGATATVYSFSCTADGGYPGSGMIVVGKQFYGTTTQGGSLGGGTVFDLDPATGTVQTVSNFPNGTVDEQPAGPLISDGSLLYGVTTGLGASNAGTVYSVDPASGALSTLYQFSGVYSGASSNATLIAAGGVLYGTSSQAGAANKGSFYALDPASGALTILHSFAGGSDGDQPVAPLLASGGTLFGVTPADGVSNFGTVFSYDIASGTKTVLHGFTAGKDGSDPGGAGVIKTGNFLFGTTGFAGAAGSGTVYRLPAAGGRIATIADFAAEPGVVGGNSALVSVGGALYGMRAGYPGQTPGFAYKIAGAAHTQTILHTFGTTAGDGNYPNAGLVYAGGRLYGTTTYGGAAQYYGTIFSLDPKTGAETVVYSFTGGADGGYPIAGLVSVGGALYGTTSSFGAGGQGTVFAFDPATSAISTLHAFTGGADGGAPSSGLLELGGVLYGTTNFGSDFNRGTVFSVTP
jgi:uncharacterized repeat protein (TIGR03803 family)